MMTSAIGKAATKATAIVEVNALSKFTSWRTLSTDMLLAPPRGIQKRRRRQDAGVFARALCPEGRVRWCPEMVNRILMAERKRI